MTNIQKLMEQTKRDNEDRLLDNYRKCCLGGIDIDSILDIFHDYKGPLGVEQSYNAISEIVNTGKEAKVYKGVNLIV